MIPHHKRAVYQLLLSLQKEIHQRKRPFYIGHVRAHTSLPGSISEANRLAANLTKTHVFSAVEEATESHKMHHQNATALRYQFKLPRETAREIVRRCSVCPAHTASLTQGVNPRGLRLNDWWQMDVTHIPEFGKLCYVHVYIDTFSHVIIASAKTGEAFKDVNALVFFNGRASKSYKK